ncbi:MULTISPECIES: ABC transporter permease [Clostridia]|uniref:ABC transporter permease n=1 Tax=Clostridia TaxID=186801 RepID=UPI000EA25854|nr:MULTISPECIES: ABC transporter permease [Clostridia]NBJ70597.1 ABC transporter permease [Roseburia sp. 1XD42-34]RKI76597.1 ABC transporter permease [Clostridium sp. 1xD42-85]
MFLAIRELLFAKTKYILISLITTLTVSLIFIVSGLAEGLSADNASSIQGLAADYLVLEAEAEGELGNSFIPMQQAKEIMNDQEQEANTLSVQMMNATIGGGDKQISLALFATERGGMLMPEVMEGRFPKQENEVLADDSLKQEGIQIGDELQLGEKTSYVVSGFTTDQRYSHTPVVFIESEDLKQVNAVAVKGVAVTDGDYSAVPKIDALGGIPSYSQEQASLNMMIIFLYVITAFVLAAFFYVMTLQKRDQFGVLKALGANNKYLISGLITQIILLSVVSVGIATAISFGVGALFPADMPFILNMATIVQPAIIIIVVSVLGAVVSLYQVVKIDPLEAIEGVAA